MFFRENFFVGVDVGTSAVKVIELTYKDSVAKLHNYGYAGLDFGGGSSDQGVSHEMRKKAYLIALLKKLKLKSKSVYLAMPGYNGLVSFIEFPTMKDEDLAKAIQYEAHKYIPADIKDVSLSWEIVKRKDDPSMLKEKKTKDAGKMEVLLVAALKKDVAKYEALVQGSEFSLKAIELETFSLMRSLSEDYRGTYLIIDIGYKVCNFVLVHEGIVRVNRNIDVGGNEITKAISDSMNISEQRAEQMKKSGRDFFHQKELSIIFPGLELTVSEAQRIIRAFHDKEGDTAINKIIVSGGSAGLKGIDKYFEEKLGIHAIIGDPWKKVSYDASVEKSVQNMGAAYSVAIGLALRGVEEYKRN
jgi:type IV pilus assembly protein PilM